MFGLSRPQPWMGEALCAEVGGDWWFAEKSDWQTVVKAKLVCRQCPVVQACLSHALETNEMFGVWGGLTAVQRHEIRMRRGMPAPAAYKDDWHGKPGGYRRHYREHTPVCERCRQTEKLTRATRSGKCG